MLEFLVQESGNPLSVDIVPKYRISSNKFVVFFVPFDSDNNFWWIGGILLSDDIYILVEFADVIHEPTFREIVCDHTVSAGVLVNQVGLSNV